jgi:hypothetical protein
MFYQWFLWMFEAAHPPISPEFGLDWPLYAAYVIRCQAVTTPR